MKWIESTQQVIDVCAEYYATRCGVCPLRPVCVESHPLTKDAINDHVKRLNELAKSVKCGYSERKGW